jgi:2-methylisocitrate lyase-like PEP mutase family enzyme
MTADLAARAEALRALHHASVPLMLPNAWDAASARAVVDAGFEAVATSSAAIARALGAEDGEKMDPAVAFAAVGRIAAAVDVPVTADMEGGYGLTATEFVERLLEAGAVGCNLEDTDHHSAQPLLEAPLQAERLAAIKDAGRAAGVDVVVNARVDTFVRAVGSPDEQLADGMHRGQLYAAAGADCVYPIVLADEEVITAFRAGVPAPVNIMLRPGSPSLARLAELGVARVSLGSGLHRLAMVRVGELLEAIQVGDDERLWG